MQPVKGALQGWQFLLQKINCVATTNIWYLKPLEQKAHVKTRSHDDIHIHYIRHFFFLNLIKLWVLVDFIHSGRCLTGPASFPPCRWRCDDGGHGQVPGPPGPAGAGGRLAPSGGLHGLQHGRPVTEVRRTMTLRSGVKNKALMMLISAEQEIAPHFWKFSPFSSQTCGRHFLRGLYGLHANYSTPRYCLI